MPLQEGSTLVVDASESAVRSGQTNPSDLLTLINRGVEVHSVKNLHAKVFVTGDQAFIGSTNVSNHSANGLLEAVVQTDSTSVVASCKQFVKSLRGEFVSPEHAKNLKKIYRPPKFSGVRHQPGRSKAAPLHSPLWIVPLTDTDWDAEDCEQKERGLPTARRRLRSSRLYSVDDFCSEGSGFTKRFKTNDVLIQVIDYGKRRCMVAPPSRVIHIQRYRRGREHRAIVFMERPKKVRERNLKVVVQQLGPKAKAFGKLLIPKSLREWAFVHALLNLWTSPHGK